MRVYELEPSRGLRKLPKSKREAEAQAAEHERLMQLMYGNMAYSEEWLELQKAMLELEQERAQLAKSKVEAASEWAEYLHDLEQQRQSREA